VNPFGSRCGDQTVAPMGMAFQPEDRGDDMAKNHGSSVKDDKTYEALREKGESKEKAARIANAKANPKMHPSEKGGHSPNYEDWTADDLQERAREIGIEGRSKMKKDELIEALRNH
jgi:Rho termination factor, N-terminal domain